MKTKWNDRPPRRGCACNTQGEAGRPANYVISREQTWEKGIWGRSQTSVDAEEAAHLLLLCVFFFNSLPPHTKPLTMWPHLLHLQNTYLLHCIAKDKEHKGKIILWHQIHCCAKGKGRIVISCYGLMCFVSGWLIWSMKSYWISGSDAAQIRETTWNKNQQTCQSTKKEKDTVYSLFTAR